MKRYYVTLDEMLLARDQRAELQQSLLRRAGGRGCLVCLTLNIPGQEKRTPMTRMLFDRGVREFEALGLPVAQRRFIDGVTGSEAFWLAEAEAEGVKAALERIEDAFAAARLFDFDVLDASGAKLSRAAQRRCLLCSEPAAACARSRRHGLAAVSAAAEALLEDFCADTLAGAACGALLDELYTTPKPGLVDAANSGAHRDMDLALLEKSARSLTPYFADAVRLGMADSGAEALRRRGLAAEDEMLRVTGGVNTHKGMVYSLGLLLYGAGRALSAGADAVETAVTLCARMIPEAGALPPTHGAAVYARYGARGARGEALAGFPHAHLCARRLAHYETSGADAPGALALCDVMAVLEDTNLLHRGGREGLDFLRQQAAAIAALPEAARIAALAELDDEMIRRGLSPGGGADMLALGFFLRRWQRLSEALFLPEER